MYFEFVFLFSKQFIYISLCSHLTSCNTTSRRHLCLQYLCRPIYPESCLNNFLQSSVPLLASEAYKHCIISRYLLFQPRISCLPFLKMLHPPLLSPISLSHITSHSCVYFMCCPSLHIMFLLSLAFSFS